MLELNADLTLPAVMRASEIKFEASPSPDVWRKRFYLHGAAESGRVTSLVRYAPGSRFPAHDHPDGEELLILEGVFSDEAGDWGPGSYLLNPEGFRHAPRSAEGCLLFVKLRQYPGPARRHVTIATSELEWQQGEASGVEKKPLYAESGRSESMRLERWRRPRRASVPRGGRAVRDRRRLRGRGRPLRPLQLAAPAPGPQPPPAQRAGLRALRAPGDTMRPVTTRAIAALLLVGALLLGAPGQLRAEEGGVTVWRVYEGTVDVLVARPLGVVQLAAGVLAFVVYGPADLVWHEDLDAFGVCLEDPFEQLFTRPLGKL